MDNPCPELDGTELEEHRLVVRLVRLADDGDVAPASFNLSGLDKTLPRPWLSIYEQECCSVENARKLAAFPYPAAIIFPVEAVTSCTTVDEEAIPIPLCVRWDCYKEGEANYGEPGACGHAGIDGLNRPTNGKRHLYSRIREVLYDSVKSKGSLTKFEVS